MDFPTFVSAAGLVNNAVSAIKNVRELAKDTSDTELKEQISEVYDVLLHIKDRVLSLDEENRTLKAQLAAKAAYEGPIPPHGYFYAADDTTKEHPLCPKCYQSSPPALGFLDKPESWNYGVRRTCKLCRNSIYEKPMGSSGRQKFDYSPY